MISFDSRIQIKPLHNNHELTSWVKGTWWNLKDSPKLCQ